MNSVGEVQGVVIDKLSLVDSLSKMPRNPSNNVHMPMSSFSSINSTHSQMRSHGREGNFIYTNGISLDKNQPNKFPPLGQLQDVMRNPVKSHSESSVCRQFTHVPSGSQASSPPRSVGLVNSYENNSLRWI